MTHKVKSGESIETIAKKYKVTESHILELNPDAKNGIEKNTVLIIMKTGGVKPSKIGTKQPSSTSAINKIEATQEVKELTGYKKHKVRRKETLYSLSKKYNVTEAEIKKHNTFLYANNLRKGDKLQIPIFKEVAVQEVNSTIVKYTVLPKEGKWRIAYKYGITVPELEALNPNLPEVLQPGQKVNVPNLDAGNLKQVDEMYSYYTVQPKEGFYRLKINTGLEQNELERLNPGLATSGLKEGMVLKIPYNGATQAADGNKNNGIIDDVSMINKLENAIVDIETKNIAIMLPFQLNVVNTDSIFDAKQKIKKSRALALTLDFYSGVLMAFDSLKKMGVNLKVNVYDTQNRLSHTNDLVRNHDFSNTDAVIGPLFPKNFNVVAAALEARNIPVVSPITKSVNLGNNVFQSRPSEDEMENKIINYFMADSSAQVIIISDIKHKTKSTMLKSKFANAKLVSSRLGRKTKKDAHFIIEQDLLSVIKPGKNVVFLETDSPNFVSNVTSMLNAFLDDKTEVILTTTRHNEAFEYEEVSNYHLSNLQFTYPSISKIVSEDSNIKFIKDYKLKYNTSPNTYAIRGFDLTMDVVLRMVSSQDIYKSVIEAPLTSYIENKFSYKKKLFGGFYNDSVYIVRYNNLQIDEVKQ